MGDGAEERLNARQRPEENAHVDLIIPVETARLRKQGHKTAYDNTVIFNW